MKFCFILVTFISLQTLCAQNTFEQGYYVTNSGEKINCLIKNMGWRNNPTTFKYKVKETDIEKTESIKNIKSFGINDNLEYQRHSLNFDLSTTDREKLEWSRSIKKKQHTVFVKKILSSKNVTLFSYQKKDLVKFFYQKNLSEPQILIHKKYFSVNSSGVKTIKSNNDFQYQLQQEFECDKNKTKHLTYTERDLKSFFAKYIECSNDDITFQKKKPKFRIKAGILGAVNFISFNHSYYNYAGLKSTFEYNNTVALKYGIFAETFLPFYNNKLSFFAESSFLKFSTENVNADISSFRDLFYEGKKLDYESLALNLSIRHYSILNPKSAHSKVKLFIGLGTTVSLYQKVKLPPLPMREKEVVVSYVLNGSLGIDYKNFKLYYQHELNRDILDNYAFRDSNLYFKSITLSVDIIGREKNN